MLLYLLQGFGLGLPAAFMPGPLQAYLFSQTMKNGWRRTLPAALAPLLSDIPVVSLTLLVTARLSPAVQRAIQVAGGLFLLYLAWGAFQTWRTYHPQEAPPEAERQSVWQAALINLLNPNPYLFWGLVGADILRRAWGETPAHALAFLAGFYILLLGGNALTIFLFGTARDALPRLNRTLIGFSALALATLGVYQLVG
ncbi:MAG: hypothetical protein Fur0018_23980 [Anaerolineales bacterium]